MVDVKALIDGYERITILSHINPDADTIGTALGIYTLLKAYGKEVEVVNADLNIPQYLDFLPNFSKIKREIEFNQSLVIACDSGSIDRLGFDLDNREILNIDHHKSNTNYGKVNIVKPTYASASQVAFEIFRSQFKIDQAVATCFYTALVSDTQYFSTNSVTKEVFDVASDMIAYDIDVSMVAYNLNQRRTLSSLRILSSALQNLELHYDGELVSMIITKERIKEAGARYHDLMGVVDHAISLATAKIAIVAIELEEVVRISMRSKGVDVATLAVMFGGGGHCSAAGFETNELNSKKLMETLIVKIKKMGLL
jgi:phosphoesterase RecJ-like protein